MKKIIRKILKESVNGDETYITIYGVEFIIKTERKHPSHSFIEKGYIILAL